MRLATGLLAMVAWTITAAGALATGVVFLASAQLAGCWRDGSKGPVDEVTSAHGAACGAKGSAIAATGQMYGQPCVTTMLQLRALLESDPDCRAFFGDAGAHVEADQLCESDGGF